MKSDISLDSNQMASPHHSQYPYQSKNSSKAINNQVISFII